MLNKQPIQRRADSKSKATAEEAVKSVKDGISSLSKGKQPDSIEVLSKVKFGKDANPFEMRVGGSPTISFKSPKPNEELSELVIYTTRMAIMEASFIGKDKETCVESASFTSKVTPGATFALTYQLASYCDIGDVSLDDKCIKFSPSSHISIFLPRFNECSETADKTELANCYCKAITAKGFEGTMTTMKPDSSTTKSSKTIETSSSTTESKSSSPSTTPSTPITSGALQSANSPFALLLVIFIMFSLIFNKRH